MAVGIEFPDIELLLKPYLASGLAAWAPLVDRRFPPPAWIPGSPIDPSLATVKPNYALVIRDDSGSDRELVSANRVVGLTGIGKDYKLTRQMIERAATLLRAAPEAETLPIAACLGVRGPYSLDAPTGRVEFYLTAELVVVGHPVTL